MYYNPTYMNPIMKGLNQGQPQQQEPLEGIASLAPQQPTQPTRPEQNPDAIRVPADPANPTGPALVQQMQMRMQQQDLKSPAFNAYFKDVMDTGGYPTKTMQQYSHEFGERNFQPLPVDPSDPTNLGGAQKGFPITEGVSQDILGNPNILGEPITPYVRNENLDLTNRGSIMDEYNKYIQGGMGSRAHTMDVRGGYSFMGEDMAPGSSTGFGDFRKFLDTYGIGDRLQIDTSSFGAQPLQQTGSGLQGLAAYQSQQNTGPGI